MRLLSTLRMLENSTQYMRRHLILMLMPIRVGIGDVLNSKAYNTRLFKSRSHNFLEKAGWSYVLRVKNVIIIPSSPNLDPPSHLMVMQEIYDGELLGPFMTISVVFPQYLHRTNESFWETERPFLWKMTPNDYLLSKYVFYLCI